MNADACNNLAEAMASIWPKTNVYNNEIKTNTLVPLIVNMTYRTKVNLSDT